MKNEFKISGALIFLITIFLMSSCEQNNQTVPAITTSDISDTTQTSAACGGIITTDGGSPISARGVCWSTNVSPTIDDNKTLNSIGTGSFSSNITGLNAGTTYHVRAYATNSVGTGYGSEKIFITLLSQAQLEDVKIQSFLSSNPLLHFQLQSGGLYYLETLTGTGPAPETNDSVYVYYTGKFLNGTIFGSNVPSGILYGFLANVGENITGFDQGVMLMKEGGSATILFPSSMGYAEGTPWIPGYTPLLFEVELVRVVKK